MKSYYRWAGLAFIVFYQWVSPPLFNYDGYMYRLQGLTPLQDINQTHLIWLPLQWLFWHAAYLFHTTSTRFFQLISIVLLGLVYVQSFGLWTRLSGSLETAAVLTLFVACAPPVWYLGSQNEPYPLLFLCVVAVLAIVHGTASPQPKKNFMATPSPVSWGEGAPCLPAGRRRAGEAKAVFWLCLATLLHQAAILLCLGFAMGLFLTALGFRRARYLKAAAWLSAAGIFIGGSYGLAAFLKGIHSPADFWNWLIGYLHTQHHLQGHWYEQLAKSIVGIAYAVTPLQGYEERLYAHFNDAQIRAGLLGLCAALVFGVSLLALRPRIRRWIRALPWQEEPVLLFSILFIGAWSFFAVFWEPTNYYWAVILFPALTLLARALRSSRIRRAPALVFLGLLSVWNMYGNFKQDAVNAQRFPDSQLVLIRRRVAKTDLLLFFKKGWHDGVDYDLLGRCLTLEGFHVEYLLDHYVVPQPTQWPPALDARLKRAFKSHQNVFMSQWVVQPALYRDLANTYFLSSYVMEKYQPLSGTVLYPEVQDFFRTQKITPLSLELRNDRFLNVTPGSEK